MNPTEMTAKRLSQEQFTDLVISSHELFESQKCENRRLGQILFTELNIINSELATELNNTEADPFYNNDNIPEFYEQILKK